MNQIVLDKYLSELSRSSDVTKRTSGWYAKKFLVFAGDKPLGEWNGTLVREFLTHLENEDYAQGTVRQAYAVAKRVFDAAKIVSDEDKMQAFKNVDINNPSAAAEMLKIVHMSQAPVWDMGKRQAPRVTDALKPAHTLEEIEAMIRAKLSGEERAYLALSTILGLRREELCRVRREYLDFEGGRIFVLTAKGGEQRWQLLPEEIIPYLDIAFNSMSVFGMTALYWRVCAKAGLEKREGYGFHAIRRMLDTVLVKKFGELMTHIFLRWKLSASSQMELRYFSEDPLATDQEVICNGHPVVTLWKRYSDVT